METVTQVKSLCGRLTVTKNFKRGCLAIRPATPEAKAALPPYWYEDDGTALMGGDLTTSRNAITVWKNRGFEFSAEDVAWLMDFDKP